MLKKIGFSVLFLVFMLLGGCVWLYSLIDFSQDWDSIQSTNPSDLEYLTPIHTSYRGKILAVVTSENRLGPTDKYTGYELTELARAYYVFKANGFDVDVASPKGGEAPMVIDNDDMGRYDYAFLNDREASAKIKHTLRLADTSSESYRAIYFVGGKGAMFDFPENENVQRLVYEMEANGKVVGAVCHGPAALLNITTASGALFLEGRTVSSFTNLEELFLMPDAREVFPFLLQDALQNNSAEFSGGPSYLEQVSVDERLITGQNPWSVWAVAEHMVRALGYEPVAREITPEENSVKILKAYETDGYAHARQTLKTHMESGGMIKRNLLAMHGIVAAMQWRWIKFFHLVALTHMAKGYQHR